MPGMCDPAERIKLVVVVGSTGAGKSQIAIDVAQRCNGEVVNADAMQMYEGLDIATNKATAAEQRGVRHHLLGIVKPHCTLNVLDFQRMATSAISDIVQRGKLPVVVGGTHYYLQALLLRSLLTSMSSTAADDTPTADTHNTALDDDDDDDETSAQQPFERLQAVDPVMAQRLHPNDTRRIKRALEIYEQTGQRASDLMRQKHQQEQCGSGALRYEVCMLHASAPSTHELYTRLDARVDTMMERGLLSEVAGMRRYLREHGVDVDTEQHVGITQAIGIILLVNTYPHLSHTGFKEFTPYFAVVGDAEDAAGDDEQQQRVRAEVLADCVRRLKTATRHYARSQQSWIRRFAQHCGLRMHTVSASDPDACAAVVNAFLRSESQTAAISTTHVDIDTWQQFQCTVCERMLNGVNEWRQHQQSRAHRQRQRKLKRRMENADKLRRTKQDLHAEMSDAPTG